MSYRTLILLLLPPCLLAACGTAAPAESGPHQETAAAAPAVSPQALQAAAGDADLRRFYAARGWQPAWDDARTQSLVVAIGRAGEHGLAPERFLDPARLPAASARRDAALTRSAIRFARALANGAVDPARFRHIYTLPRAQADVVPGLVQAVATGRIARWFAGLAPGDPQYRALSRAYRTAAAAEPANRLPRGKTLRVGDTDARVPAIRAALLRLGYPAESGPGEAESAYSPALARAVTAMQDDFGLRRDGVIGPATLAVLNRSAAERARQLAVNLERLRWLERSPPATRIDVNTGAAELVYWRDGEPIDRRRVAVGRPGWPTPQLGAPIFRLVANPSWTVPRSIARSELAGKSAGWLRARNMQRRGGWIVQRPGPGNALGQVKFDMRDRYAIYLHDTSARQVFERDERHVSHGCVRVSDALGLARVLAEHDGKREAFDAALASGRERFVPLDRPVPVRLIYLTTYADAAGKVRFRPDLYGWDEEVGKALRLGHARRPDAPAPASDIAP